MKLELLIFGITGFLILNTYYDGKYTKMLMLGQKYFKMAMFGFIGISIYLFIKKNPKQSKTLLGHANDIIRYMPIDKNTADMVAPLFVGRKLSVNALNNVMLNDKRILLVTQKNSEDDNPKIENLYTTGTLSKVLQLLKLPDGTIKVLVEGIERIKINKFETSKDFITANYSVLNIKSKSSTKTKALIKIIIEQFSSSGYE